MTDIQFNMESNAAHGMGECPACEAPIHVVASPDEGRLRWCCLRCSTVGSAPFESEDLRDDMEEDDTSSLMLH